MLAVDLSYMAFIMLSYIPSIPSLLRVFIMEECCILSDAFLASIETVMWFLSFILLMWYITLTDLHTLNHPCIPGINPTWLRCIRYYWPCRMSLEVFPSPQFFGRVWERLVLLVLWMFGVIFQWGHLFLGFSVWGGFWLPIKSLVIGLFRFSISSWFSLGRLYAWNLSTSSRLSDFLAYHCS